MQNLIKHKFSFIVSILLLGLPIFGSFIFSFSQPHWDRLLLIFPMFILTYADSFPVSIFEAIFITMPIYISGIIGTLIYLFTKSKRTFFLKGMLFTYLVFFIITIAISLCSLVFLSFEKITLEALFGFLVIIFWGIFIYKAAVKFDIETNLPNLTN